MRCVHNLGESFQIFRKHARSVATAGLTFKPSRPKFGSKSVEYFGRVFYAEGIAVRKDLSKLSKIYVRSSVSKIFRSVLGVMNFVRRFAPNSPK